MSDLGGEAACWLDRVCDACGGVIAADEVHECRSAAATTDGAQDAPGDAGLR